MEPPEDPELRRTIEAMAPFVARNGPAFEALATKLNAGNPAFGFLSGGRGAEYYRWRVQVGEIIEEQGKPLRGKLGACSCVGHRDVLCPEHGA